MYLPGQNSKIMTQKGRKHVARITSADGGICTTAVICMSAGGNFVPPVIIFACKKIKKELNPLAHEV